VWKKRLFGISGGKGNQKSQTWIVQSAGGFLLFGGISLGHKTLGTLLMTESESVNRHSREDTGDIVNPRFRQLLNFIVNFFNGLW
jgi:hypothetical protein